jgi:hypothetical protein
VIEKKNFIFEKNSSKREKNSGWTLYKNKEG